LADARLTGSEKRALILWVICGVLGLLFAQRYFFRAFPEAAVDFKVSRTDAQQRAKNFVQGLDENLDGYQSTITFQVDDNAKTYLERELGLQKANRLMSSELNIWFWEVRFFKPQQEEEYQVRVSPAGKVVAYNHKIEEARAAAARVQQQETQKAIAAAELIIVKSREAAAQDHERMLAELKREVGRLVVQTTANVTGKILTPEDQRRLAEETTKQLAA